MGSVPYRLVALDVDGTLLTRQGTVTPETKRVLQKLHEQGVHVALATGRRYIIAQFLPPLLEIPLFLLLSNGAVIRDHTGAILYHRHLPLAWAWRAIAAARQVGLQATVYENAFAGDHILVDGDWATNKNAQAALRRRPELAPLYRDLNEVLTAAGAPDPIEIVLWGPEPPLRVVRDALRASGLPYTLIFWTGGASSSFVREECALEILGPDVSKASALAWLCQHLQVTPTETVAFGDDVNDVEMLRFAGLGVAVGNATERAREAADLVTDHHDDDGVARMLERLFALGDGAERGAADLARQGEEHS